jgi:hypothetical protein
MNKFDNTQITIEVGGTKFITLLSTLQAFPNTKLGSITNNQYKFDRDPNLFPYILSYYRNGFIMFPKNLDQEIIANELSFWNLPLGIYNLAPFGEKVDFSKYIETEQTIYGLKKIIKALKKTNKNNKLTRLDVKQIIEHINESIKITEQKLHDLQKTHQKLESELRTPDNDCMLFPKKQITFLQNMYELYMSVSHALERHCYFENIKNPPEKNMLYMELYVAREEMNKIFTNYWEKIAPCDTMKDKDWKFNLHTNVTFNKTRHQPADNGRILKIKLNDVVPEEYPEEKKAKKPRRRMKSNKKRVVDSD